MLLNSNQVFKYLQNAQSESIQQVSVDLHLKSVKRIQGGLIFKNRRDILTYRNIPTTYLSGRNIWVLNEGTYSVTFEEDCKIPDNRTGMILHRSSLVRIGGTLDCGIFDPGYNSKHGMGAVLTVGKDCTIELERGCAIATFYMFENPPVEPDLLYKGIYQDK